MRVVLWCSCNFAVVVAGCEHHIYLCCRLDPTEFSTFYICCAVDSVIYSSNVFSQSEGCFLTFLMVSFEAQKF